MECQANSRWVGPFGVSTSETLRPEGGQIQRRAEAEQRVLVGGLVAVLGLGLITIGSDAQEDSQFVKRLVTQEQFAAGAATLLELGTWLGFGFFRVR